MYCAKCGAQNSDNAWKCVQCGQVLRGAGAGPAQPPVRVPNYLVPAILCTLFCCLPLGIVAIVFAAQVNSKVAAGDIPGAMEASNKAKLFSWLSFGIGLAIGVVYVLLVVLAEFGNM